jgi:hypothetical protein
MPDPFAGRRLFPSQGFRTLRGMGAAALARAATPLDPNLARVQKPSQGADALCFARLTGPCEGLAGGLPQLTGVSQPWRSSAAPDTVSKKAVWSCSVIGPRRPSPMAIRSTDRIGVTSAAVPVKKSSSAV